MDADFCISSTYVTSRTKQSFWSLNFPALGGLKWKKYKKKHEILAFKPLIQEIWLKNLTSRKFFRTLEVHLSFKIKKKNVMAMWNSPEKIKSAIPHEQNHMPWLVKTSKTVFSKLTWQISLPVSGKQARRQVNTWPIAFFSQIFRYFPAF